MAVQSNFPSFLNRLNLTNYFSVDDEIMEIEPNDLASKNLKVSIKIFIPIINQFAICDSQKNNADNYQDLKSRIVSAKTAVEFQQCKYDELVALVLIKELNLKSMMVFSEENPEMVNLKIDIDSLHSQVDCARVILKKMKGLVEQAEAINAEYSRLVAKDQADRRWLLS